MRQPPKMPQIPMGVPMLGQNQQPSREEQARAGIAQAMQQISLSMYQELATRYLGTRDTHEAIDPEYLRELARSTQAAAQAYFQGIGIIDSQGD